MSGAHIYRVTPAPNPYRQAGGAVPRPTPKRSYTTRETAIAVFMLVAGYFYIRLFVNAESRIGKTLFVFLLTASSAVFINLLGKRITACAALSGAVCLAFGISYTLCPPGASGLISAIIIHLSYIYFIYKCFDSSIEGAPGILFDFEIAKAAFSYPFSSFGAIFPAVFAPRRKKSGKNSKIALYVILGLLVSIIPTIIIAGLLSYDESFAELIGNIGDIDLSEYIISAIFGLPAAMYLFGLWISSVDRKHPNFNEAHCRNIRSKYRVAPTAAVISAVTPILIVYALFFFSQLSYFTSAFSGKLPEGYSFSAYARSGFFELCAVTLINTAILAAMYLFTKRKNALKNDGGIKAYIILICLSNLILIATAISKMLLYINTYGLTLLRVYTTWFMLTLALVFAVYIVSLLVKKIKIVPTALAIILIMSGAAALSNVPKLVSSYNTERIMSGEVLNLDEDYFDELGAAAVPDAVRLEKSDKASETTKSAATHFLDRYKAHLKVKDSDCIFSFNVTDAAAEEALGER